MRILLVQVPTSHLGAEERVYPLGLSRLSKTVPDHFEKRVLDMNLSRDPWQALKNKLLAASPHWVALSFRNLDPLAGQQTSYLSSLKTAARLVRALVPDAGIMAGGPAFSLFGRRLMEEIPEIDCGIRGEAEAVFPLLLKDSFNPGAVPGLIWRNSSRSQDKGRIQENPIRDPLALDDLPSMDTKAFCPRQYTAGNKYVAAMGIEGKRGCDLQCAYCVYPQLGGRKMRLRSPRIVVAEMEYLHKEFGTRLFHFTDGVLNRPADHFEAVCREILQRKLHVGWTGFFREDHITRRGIDLAASAGLAAIYFSADSLSEHGLKILNKRLTKEDILRAAAITAQEKILTMCHFLVNLPGETENHASEANDMLDRILDIHGDAGNLGAVILNTVRLYPTAPLTRKLLKKGLLDPEIDLLYPTYYNPRTTSRRLHEMETRCHAAGVFSRLKVPSPPNFFLEDRRP
ncbi:MAG: radical SAM protein [Deltaproteobacteria bacterium]|nr:radical SAM protein [Deltaproteobacteria bacterium]